MADLRNELLDGILARLAGRSVSDGTAAAAAAATPTPSPQVSEKERAQAITAIIAESYAMPNVPEHVRRRCAKRRIESEYGIEHAAKYLRGRKRSRVPAEQTPAESAPPESAPAASTVPEPTPEPTPAAAAAPIATQPPAEPVLALDSELQRLLRPPQ